MAVSLPHFCPLLAANDSLVEADTPYLRWLETAAGDSEQILPWLLRRIEGMRGTMLEKTALYDALKLNVMEAGRFSRTASRTHARHDPPAMYLHREPLIPRNQVSLTNELASQPIPIRKLSRPEGEQLLDKVRAALTVRYRELYGTDAGRFRKRGGSRGGPGCPYFPLGIASGKAFTAARLPCGNYV